MRLVCDDTAKKKVGRHSASSDRYPNGRAQPDKHTAPCTVSTCLGHHAHAPEALAGPLSQRAEWLGTLSQSQAGPQVRRAVGSALYSFRLKEVGAVGDMVSTLPRTPAIEG